MLSRLKTIRVSNAAFDRASDREARLLQRNVILFLLSALATAAWVMLVGHGHTTMEMTVAAHKGAAVFVTDWTVMMVAMMFPTSAPMILTFHRVQAVKQPDYAFVNTWVFAIAYLSVWVFAGILAYAGVLITEAAAIHRTLGSASEMQIGGAIVMVGGLYQLTPVKELCLSICRRPINFIVRSWHDGTAGVLRLGVLYGLYCVGCCWFLFAILFPLGMNVATMMAITLIIFGEKVLPWPTLMRYSTGIAFVLYGVLVIVLSQPN